MRTPSRVVVKFVRRAALGLWLAPALVAAQDLARMEQLIRARVDDKSFMGTVLVARGDEVLLSKGYGSANLEWQLPNTPTTNSGSARSPSSSRRPRSCCSRSAASSRSRIPSRSTGPTRRLRGTRSRSSTCSRTARGFPTSRITPNTCRPGSSRRRRPRRDRLLPRQAARLRARRAHELQQLGLRAAGLPRRTRQRPELRRFLRDNIFKPLGMNDSGYDVNAAVMPKRAAGYSPSPTA